MRHLLPAVTFVAIAAFFAASVQATTWTYLRIPHLAFGGGYTSFLTIGDPQGLSNRLIKISLYKDDGSPLAANLEGIGSMSSYSFTLNTLAERTIVLHGGSSVASGWVLIAAEGMGNLDASLRFSVADGSGNVTDAVGVLPSEANYVWTLPVERWKSVDYTGVAIANPWSNSVSVTVDLYQGGTRVPGTVPYSVTLAPLGHWAGFVHQLFPSPYSVLYGPATLRISSTTDTFCAVALRGDGSQYSSLPANPGVEMWSWTYNDSTATIQSGIWNWRFNDGVSFVGNERNLWTPDVVFRLRGALDEDAGSFVAERWVSSTDPSQGTVIFQGALGQEGGTEVINGTRTTLNKDGAATGTVTFKATRLH